LERYRRRKVRQRDVGMIERIKTYLICILLAFLGISGFVYSLKQKELDALTVQVQGLEKDLKQKVVIEKSIIKTLYRDREGKTVYRTIYLPAEGSVVVNQSTDSAKIDEVIIKDKGFCFRPGFGFVYSDKILPVFDLKVVYFKRWSLMAPSANLDYIGIGVSRHVDDLLEWTHMRFENTEVYLNGGHEYKGSWRFGVGLRMNL